MEHDKPEIAELPAKRTKGDDSTSVVQIADLAKLVSDAKVQYEMGKCYMDGDGVTRDPQKAAKWWKEAADQGHRDAQLALAKHYIKHGDWDEKREAHELLGGAARQGSPDAEYELGTCFWKGIGKSIDRQKAAMHWMEAAAKNHAPAQRCLVHCYAIGMGVAAEQTKSMDLCTKLAENGDAWAQERLGFIYLNGHLVQRDEAKGIEWLTKAADQGQIDAQFRLALCHTIGQGVAKDTAKAFEWWAKAVEQQGDTDDMCLQDACNDKDRRISAFSPWGEDLDDCVGSSKDKSDDEE